MKKTFDVITIGSATRDVFLESELFRVVRDPSHLKKLGFPTGEAQCFALGGKIEVDHPVFAFGGGAANAAVTFRRAGFRTATVAKIGSDENGQAILENLKKEKITPFVAVDKKIGTAYSAILLAPSGERTILNYRGASEDLKVSEMPLAKTKGRVAYISPGRIAFPVMSAIVRSLKKGGFFIAMNPSKHYLDLGARRLAPMLKAIDVIIMNREEAAYLTGQSYEAEARIFKKFNAIIPGLAVMTDGPNGVLVSNGKKI